MYTETLDDLQTLEGDKTGGLCKIYFQASENFDSIPGWRTVLESLSSYVVATNHANWDLATGIDWLLFDDLQMNSDFAENNQQGEAGLLYETALSFVLNWDAQDERGHALRALQRQRFIVRFHNQDGVVRVMGNNENGASFSASYSAADGQWKCQFMWQSEEPCLYVNGWS